MNVFVRDESWSWLSRNANLEDSLLLGEIKAFLRKDFGQAFEVIRTQKLLSRSRCRETTTSLCTELENWAKTAPFSGKERDRLIRHCRVTVGFQSMMSSIRAQTEALEIWHLSFADFASILLSSMEATNVAFNQSLIEQTLASGVEQFLLLNSKKSWLMRANLDSAQLVLNEGRKRCSDHSDFKVGNPSAFVQSLELARQTTEVMLAWDHYSFGRVEVSIRKNEIRVNRPDTLTSLRSGNYRERMMQLDITDRSSTHQRFSMLSEKLKADISAEQFSLPFDEFIASPTGRRTLEELRPLTETHEKELSNRLDLLIDLDSQVKLGRLRHVYRDLVTIWCYLTRIAMIARVWGELVLASTGEYPVPILTLNRLREAFVGLRELEESSINKGIRHFSSSIDQKPIVDLFHQPLLRLSDAVVLIPPSYILSSRFDRNLISVVAREKNDSVAVKG